MKFTLREVEPGLDEVSLIGDLDGAAAEAIEVRFAAAIGTADRHVIIDLTHMSFIASLGLRLIIAAARAVNRHGRQMVLYGAQPAVMDVFETVALSDLIPVEDTASLARARIGL